MNEEALIYAAMILVGLPVMIIAIVRGGTIGTGDTLAGLLVICGIAGAVRSWRSRSKLPKAWARRRESDGDAPPR